MKDRYGDNPLQVAVKHDHPNCLKILLENGGNIHCKAKNGYTLLHLAAQANGLAAIKLLISHGFDPNSRGKNQETALHVAAGAGHLSAISLLIENGANVCSRDKKAQVSLHWAAQKGHAGCIKILSKEGQIIDALDRSNTPPLFFAVVNGYDECVKALLESGANPNLEFYLHTAVHRQHLKCITPLVKAGADVNKLDNNGFRPLDIAINRDVDCVKMLIKMGADLNKPNESKCSKHSPIYRTLDTYSIRDTQTAFDSMIALVQNGVNLDMKEEMFYEGTFLDSWRTPLHKAAYIEELSSYIQPLIDGGADLTIQDDLGSTALDIAKKAKHKTAIALLEAAVAVDQKHPMKNGYTPLHDAIAHNDVALVRRLLSEGARANQPEKKSTQRDKPLHMALRHNNVAIIELLIEHGAYIDAQNNTGSTPLCIAVLNNYTEAVSKLIEKGADVERLSPALGGATLLKIAVLGATIAPKKDFSKVIALIQKVNKA